MCQEFVYTWSTTLYEVGIIIIPIFKHNNTEEHRFSLSENMAEVTSKR